MGSKNKVRDKSGLGTKLDVLSGEDKAARFRELQAERERKVAARRAKIKDADSKSVKLARKQIKAKRKAQKVASDEFLDSYEWRKLRYRVIKKFGRTCMCCGRRAPEVKIHVDHIKPRKKYPELALAFDNLQVLCHECNHGKGNWDETDWRN